MADSITISPVQFNRGKNRSQIVGDSINKNTIYFAKDGGIYVGTSKKAIGTVTTSTEKRQILVDGDVVDILSDGADIVLSKAYAETSEYKAPIIGDSMDTAVGKLTKGLDDIRSDVESTISSVSEDDGVKVSLGGTSLKPTITVTTTTLDTDTAITSTAGGVVSGKGVRAVINALDVADSAVTGELVSSVSEENGKISVIRKALADTDIKIVKISTPSTGYASQYKLVSKDGSTALGETINIPKDQFLKTVNFYQKSADVPTDQIDYPANFVFPGIRFEWETKTDETATTWVSVKDLVDIYTAGNGISVDNNVISAKIQANSKLSVNGDGLTVDTAAWNVTGVDTTASHGVNLSLTSTKVGITVADGSITTGNTNLVTGGQVYTELAKKKDLQTSVTVTPSNTKYISKLEQSNQGVVTATLTDIPSYKYSGTTWKSPISSFEISNINSVTIGTTSIPPSKNNSGSTTTYSDGYMTQAQSQNLDMCVVALTWEES